MGPIGKTRSPIAVFLLSIITCAIYGIYWYIMSFVELKTFRQNRGLGLGVYIVLLILFPIPLLWMLPKDIGDAFAEIGQPKAINGNLGFWIFLPIIGGFIWFFSVVGAYNKLWAATQSAPQ